MAGLYERKERLSLMYESKEPVIGVGHIWSFMVFQVVSTPFKSSAHGKGMGPGSWQGLALLLPRCPAGPAAHGSVSTTY